MCSPYCPASLSGFESSVGDSPLHLLEQLSLAIGCLRLSRTKTDTCKPTAWTKACKCLTGAATGYIRSGRSSSSSRSGAPSLSTTRHRTRRPHSSFAATGKENLRVMLAGCHGGLHHPVQDAAAARAGARGIFASAATPAARTGARPLCSRSFRSRMVRGLRSTDPQICTQGAAAHVPAGRLAAPARTTIHGQTHKSKSGSSSSSSRRWLPCG
jgi:hypothetical protein